MSRLPCVFAIGLLLAGSEIVNSRIHAQGAAAGQPVNNILTADGVRLKGTFFESSKANAGTVIMLHPIGEDKSSKAPEWRSLAEALAKAGYAVLMFDFRGHGDSTMIEDWKLFRSKAINAHVKTKDKETIDVKDYIRSGSTYLPVLVNDIAAARAWLDRRSDESKDCNTSNLMVIGAEQGATLGAIWMNAEWHRYKYTPNPMFPTLVPHPMNLDSRPEGKDIIAAVFLTPLPSLEKRPVSLSRVLRVACYDNGTPTVIFHGKEDIKATTYAKSLADALKPRKESKKHAFIGTAELKTKRSGVKLLQDGLNTKKAIVEYLDSVKADRAVDRSDRGFLDNIYMWRFGNSNVLLPARISWKNESKTLNFDDYNRFITQ
jgi:hypothetical protein